MELPETIILDVAPLFDAFSRYAYTAGETYDFVYEVTHSVFNSVLCSGDPEYYLRQFCAEVEFAEHMGDDRDLPTIRPHHAEAILNYGLAVLEYLRRMGYHHLTQAGIEYQFEGLVHKDVVVVKTEYYCGSQSTPA